VSVALLRFLSFCIPACCSYSRVLTTLGRLLGNSRSLNRVIHFYHMRVLVVLPAVVKPSSLSTQAYNTSPSLHRRDVSLPIRLRWREHQHNRLRRRLLLNDTNQTLLPTPRDGHVHAGEADATFRHASRCSCATWLDALDDGVVLCLRATWQCVSTQTRTYARESNLSDRAGKETDRRTDRQMGIATDCNLELGLAIGPSSAGKAEEGRQEALRSSSGGAHTVELMTIPSPPAARCTVTWYGWTG
jgi:hypothetical protein